MIDVDVNWRCWDAVKLPWFTMSSAMAASKSFDLLIPKIECLLITCYCILNVILRFMILYACFCIDVIVLFVMNVIFSVIWNEIILSVIWLISSVILIVWSIITDNFDNFRRKFWKWQVILSPRYCVYTNTQNKSVTIVSYGLLQLQ